MADRFEEAGQRFSELTRTMARLRAPGGCPWDRKQTYQTIKSYLLEETYEVLDAVDNHNWKGLEDELGDLLLQPVFFAEIAAEDGRFTISDSLDRINQKLVRRHPHIFADAHAETPEEVKVKWDEIKKQEKAQAGLPLAASILDDVPRAIPALVEAEKIGKKAASQSFDWPDISGAVAKLEEEVKELVGARQTTDPALIEHELGDLLFTLVNIARHLQLDPEQALRKANGRFRQRFAYVERKVLASRIEMKNTPLETLEDFWQQAKAE